MARFDKLTETLARGIARGTSRRSLLAWLGAGMTGAAAFPVLPVARAATPEASHGPHAAGAARPAIMSGLEQDPGDRSSCDYWRYCAIDGFLCSCCGGSVNTCPPGTEMSPITWIGTCTNPADGRAYVISYNDCCGTSSCGQLYTCVRAHRGPQSAAPTHAPPRTSRSQPHDPGSAVRHDGRGPPGPHGGPFTATPP